MSKRKRKREIARMNYYGCFDDFPGGIVETFVITREGDSRSPASRSENPPGHLPGFLEGSSFVASFFVASDDIVVEIEAHGTVQNDFRFGVSVLQKPPSLDEKMLAGLYEALKAILSEEEAVNALVLILNLL